MEPQRHSSKDSWFQTYTGKKFHVLEPQASDVDIEDIAHALSFTCRYGGHCRDFYSVAQHSIYVVQALQEISPFPLLHVQGLLHDAAEAYVGDMKRPIKRLMPKFMRMEDHVIVAVHEALNVPIPTPDNAAMIHWADNSVLMAERRDILTHTDFPWSIKEPPWNGKIEPWPHPDDGYMNFILKWRELYNTWINNSFIPGLCGIATSREASNPNSRLVMTF